MKKTILFSLVLLVSSIVSAQKLSVEQTACNSLKVKHLYQTKKQYVVVVIEKEQIEDVWAKIARIKLYENEYEFDDLQNGNYRVTLITPFKKKKLSNTVLIECSSYKNESLATFQVDIFPNPATSELQIQIPTIQKERYSYQIFSTQGVLIKEGIITEQIKTITVDQIKQGMYFLKVISPNQSLNIKKIIIK